jgi:hypothetical protein
MACETMQLVLTRVGDSHTNNTNIGKQEES